MYDNWFIYPTIFPHPWEVITRQDIESIEKRYQMNEYLYRHLKGKKILRWSWPSRAPLMDYRSCLQPWSKCRTLGQVPTLSIRDVRSPWLFKHIYLYYLFASCSRSCRICYDFFVFVLNKSNFLHNEIWNQDNAEVGFHGGGAQREGLATYLSTSL